MDAKTLKSIRFVHDHRILMDRIEWLYKYGKEKVLGVDCCDYSVFDKTILYYKEVKGQDISYQEALSRALDKKRHKDAWFTRERNTIEDIRHFYQEVDVYPFRQPYFSRFGGYRWYVRLLRHINKPSILEYGCGSAVLTEWLLERFPNFDYTVADIPSVTLDFVKWKKEKFGYNYTILTIGPGKEGIPLSQNYALIICQDVLEHTPNSLEIVSAFIEHLSPGGVLVVDFMDAPGGENLEVAVEQRKPVKTLLKEKLIPLKPIDEPEGNDGLYVKDME